MNLTINASERWIILGKTGSGKTELAKYLLRVVSQKMPVVIIDPKEYWLGAYPKWASRKEAGTIDKPHLINTFNPKYRVQLLQPDPDDKEDDRLARLCYDVLRKGNWFLYFDETEDIGTANSVPRHIRRIWKTGRAKGVGAWISTQTPSGIPRIFKSQAEHFIAMKVGQQDNDLVASLVHSTHEQVAALKPYEWLYYNTKMDTAQLMPPVPYKGK